LQKRNKYVPGLLLLPFILVTLMVLAAIVNIVIQSLGYIPSFDLYEITLKYYIESLKRPEVLESLAVSLKISIIASIGAAVIGTLVCAALVKTHSTKGGLLNTIRLPILVPHTVVAVFTVTILSQTGIIARVLFALGCISDYNEFPMMLYDSGYVGVMLAYLWKEIPFIAYYTLALMSSVSETLGEAAENLGASPLKSFFHVTLPMSMPAIAKSFLIVLVYSFGAYELPMLMGATTPKAFPVYTYIAFIKPNFKDRPYAMAMNGITLIISLIMVITYALLMRKLNKKLGGGADE